MFQRLLLFYYLIGVCLNSVRARTDEELKLWFMQKGLECNKDHPISPEDMLLLHKHKMPDTGNAKCLLACIYRKAGMLDSKGMFDIQSSTTMAETEYSSEPTKIENAKKVYDMCKKVNEATVADGENGCERSHHLFECLIENAPKMGFKI